MKQVGKFIATTKRLDVDPSGATEDTIYAEAVLANAPTTVVKEKGLLMVRDVPGQSDSVTFPIFNNFKLSWTNISGTGSDLGSEIETTQGGAGRWKKLTPVGYSAGLFISDEVDISTNRADFELYAKLGGVEVSRKIDQDSIQDAIMNAATESGSNVYSAGGFVAEGSVGTGSTLTPSDISKAKTLLSTGSNIYHPNVILLHPNQYNQLVMHQDFSNNANTAALKKAVFKDGQLIAYDGMEIVTTELVNSGTDGGYVAPGHPAAVFTRAKSGALATKNSAFRVTTEDSRLRHGKYKIFDIRFKADVLIPESIVIIRCSD